MDTMSAMGNQCMDMESCMAAMPAKMMNMMSRMERMPSEEFDSSFLQSIMRHHMGAIMTSRLAQEKATHPELVEFGRKLEVEQQREIDKLSACLNDWYGMSISVTPMSTDKEMTARIEGLQGKQFEIGYMQELIKHHMQGIYMAQMAEQKACHSDLKRAASKMVKNQTNEIKQLCTWLSEWYGLRV